jgi:hypothetical protein
MDICEYVVNSLTQRNGICQSIYLIQVSYQLEEETFSLFKTQTRSLFLIQVELNVMSKKVLERLNVDEFHEMYRDTRKLSRRENVYKF